MSSSMEMLSRRDRNQNSGQQQEIYEQEKVKKKKILRKYPRVIRRKRV